MTSLQARNNPMFLRNTYRGYGKWNIPSIKRQNISLDNLKLIPYSDVKANDSASNKQSGVHFFVDDYRFKGIFDHPARSLTRLSQYKIVLSPDFSLYAEMPLWRQIEHVSKNRWCGAYWQANGLKVIPTISWSSFSSFDFCFDGVEQNAIVAVSTVGCKKAKTFFMRGYDTMLERLNPSHIICYGKPFSEMQGNLIIVDYLPSGKVVC